MAVGLQSEINVTGAISAGLSWSFSARTPKDGVGRLFREH
jgi:hypothetical protein